MPALRREQFPRPRFFGLANPVAGADLGEAVGGRVEDCRVQVAAIAELRAAERFDAAVGVTDEDAVVGIRSRPLFSLAMSLRIMMYRSPRSGWLSTTARNVSAIPKLTSSASAATFTRRTLPTGTDSWPNHKRHAGRESRESEIHTCPEVS